MESGTRRSHLESVRCLAYEAAGCGRCGPGLVRSFVTLAGRGRGGRLSHAGVNKQGFSGSWFAKQTLKPRTPGRTADDAVLTLKILSF